METATEKNHLLENFKKELVGKTLPQHIGIIMDGNTRWANKNNLAKEEGYKTGAKALEKIINSCLCFQIPTLTLYAFSTENWNRKKSEVDFLMSLLKEYSEKYLPVMEEKNIHFRLLGDLSALQVDVRENLLNTVSKTKEKSGLNLCMAINYGGRNEIVRAINKVIKEKQTELTEEEFSNHLDTAGLPDVDLIIRTSGEQRISNFLLWQSAYAEFYFCKTLWPDFNEQEFYNALVDFSKRNRTKGYSRI
jgi:undecaprenyl diphosphate synthase